VTGAVDVAYDAHYLNWVLGPSHPTNAVRAQLAVELLERELPARGLAMNLVEPIATSAATLYRVHDENYVQRTLEGLNQEWSGWAEPRPDLGRSAALMCGGTEVLAHRILAGQTRVGFNPQGAKHHAHRDHGSGFCVFNDMAVVADLFVSAGRRVAYVDIDAHHGDGVEALLRDVPQALTASIHSVPLFPGTGLASDADAAAFNWPLHGPAGDAEWLEALSEAVELIRGWQPSVLLAAIGADAHRTDPLSPLQVTEDGYAEAGRVIGRLAADLEVPVLIGGAGGYQPLTWTPRLWASVVTEIGVQLLDGHPVAIAEPSAQGTPR
jgi:acetoin utilization protein AcuC